MPRQLSVEQLAARLAPERRRRALMALDQALDDWLDDEGLAEPDAAAAPVVSLPLISAADDLDAMLGSDDRQPGQRGSDEA